MNTKKSKIDIKRCMEELERNMYNIVTGCTDPRLASFNIVAWKDLDDNLLPKPEIRMEFSFRTEEGALGEGSPRIKGAMGVNPWPKPCGDQYSLWSLFNKSLNDIIEMYEKKKAGGQHDGND